MKITEHYNKEHDIYSASWGKNGEVESSIELFDGQLILDIAKDGSVVGFELFDFLERVKEQNKKMAKLFRGKK